MQLSIGKRKFHQRHGIVCPSQKQSLFAYCDPRVRKVKPKMSLLHLSYNICFNQNIRILELLQIGLIDYWDTWFRPMPPQCNGKPPNGNKTKKLSPLSLKNLTGAFLVLLVGLSLSILAFLVEKVIYVRQRHHSHTSSKLQQVIECDGLI